MTNVVLMAGKGKRFKEAGYTVSKPLLSVSGKPMVLRAVEGMPPADTWVFVVREEHIAEKSFIKTLASSKPNVIVLVDPHPAGQLNSCLVAKEFYNNDESLFIGACDFGMTYDPKAYESLMSLKNPERPDVVAWSFTEQENLKRSPQAWGWLKQDKRGWVHGVSVKIPVSDDPFHDFAIAGSFTFARGRMFLETAEDVMARGIPVYGEFYIDSVLGRALELGYGVKSFPVQYIGWGTPADYEKNKNTWPK